MRCLVIEDERKVADFVARGLRAERFAVDVAYDGQGGWELASVYDYDLIILALMLPGLGGAAAAKRQPGLRTGARAFQQRPQFHRRTGSGRVEPEQRPK